MNQYILGATQKSFGCSGGRKEMFMPAQIQADSSLDKPRVYTHYTLSSVSP
jgi:hypothetical protein